MTEIERYDSETLDDFLSRWHSWAKGDQVARGHAKESLVIGQHRNHGLQYESQVEQQDARSEKSTCRAIDFQVRSMEDPYQAAIYCEARNIVNGLSVWSSPRLPQDPATRDAIVREARAMLTRRLKAVGVM